MHVQCTCIYNCYDESILITCMLVPTSYRKDMSYVANPENKPPTKKTLTINI